MLFNRFAVAMLVITLVACGDGDDSRDVSEAHFGGDGGDSGTSPPDVPPCDDPLTETRFPSNGMGNVVVLCSSCGPNACAELGDPCASYGAPCDAGGADGVCVSCCDGAEAELRCSPL